MKHTLQLFGEIADWYYGLEWLTWKLENYKDGDEVEVNISSIGGDLKEALAMIDYFRSKKIKPNFNIIGYAASAATLLMSIGAKNTMTASGLALLHNASDYIRISVDNIDDLKEEHETIQKAVLSVYSEKLTVSEDELKTIMTEEKLLGAERCKEIGLIDEITSDAVTDKLPETVKASYLNTIRMSMSDAPWQSNKQILSNQEKQKNNFNNNEDISMKTGEETTDSNAEMQELKVENTQLKTDLAGLKMKAEEGVEYKKQLEMQAERLANLEVERDLVKYELCITPAEMVEFKKNLKMAADTKGQAGEKFRDSLIMQLEMKKTTYENAQMSLDGIPNAGTPDNTDDDTKIANRIFGETD